MGKHTSEETEELDELVEVPGEDGESQARRRGWFARRKARARAAWRGYVDNSIPADDDADEGLPPFLRGHRGRIIFAVATMLLLFGWALGVGAIVF